MRFSSRDVESFLEPREGEWVDTAFDDDGPSPSLLLVWIFLGGVDFLESFNRSAVVDCIFGESGERAVRVRCGVCLRFQLVGGEMSSSLSPFDIRWTCWELACRVEKRKDGVKGTKVNFLLHILVETCSFPL